MGSFEFTKILIGVDEDIWVTYGILGDNNPHFINYNWDSWYDSDVFFMTCLIISPDEHWNKQLSI